ncbi:MAG: exo-alpha-sialidase [Candidatus Aenigmatarchaeota archaeon]|nr:MAG: exo-alpha-sialidase [Candidatus Aenigmarchaeota archaeon]
MGIGTRVATALILVLVITPSLVLAADTNSGPFRGDAFLKISEDLTPTDAVFYKLTTDLTEGAAADPENNDWDFNAAVNVTVHFLNATSGTPPPIPNGGATDIFRIELYYDNTTTADPVAFLYNALVPPVNDTNFTFMVYARGANISGTTANTPFALVAPNDTTLYASFQKNGPSVAKSTDSGTTWTVDQVNKRGNTGITQIRLDAVNTTLVYIAYDDNPNKSVEVAKTTDGGTTWAITNNSNPVATSGTTTTRLSMDAFNDTVVYLSYKDGTDNDLRVMKTTDGGTTWATTNGSSPVDSAGDVGSDSSIIAIDANTVYVAYRYTTEADLKVAKTTDGGTTWTIANNSFPVDQIGGQETSISALDANTVFVAYQRGNPRGFGVAKTTDGGTNWTILNGTNSIDPLVTVRWTSIQAISNDTLYVAYQDNTHEIVKVAKTTDGGTNWTLTTVDSSSAMGRGVGLVAKDANNLYLGYRDFNNSLARFSKTTDGGEGWSGYGSGVFRLKMRVRSVTGATTDYDADTEAGITDATQQVTYDSTRAQGFVRVNTGVTKFTSYKDINYTQNETRFMRGETVYMKVNTNAAAWNETGAESMRLTLTGPTTTLVSFPFNLTRNDNAYRFNWTMQSGVDLNDYDVVLNVTGNTSAFTSGDLWTQFNSSSVGFVNANKTNFSTTLMTDPDGVLSDTNASFWVEDGLRVAQDYGPRLNGSNSSTINAYVQRGEVVNVSFIVLDEWNRTFANREIFWNANTSGYEPAIARVNTSRAAYVACDGYDTSLSVVNTTTVYVAHRNRCSLGVKFTKTTNGGQSWSGVNVSTLGIAPSLEAFNSTLIYVSYTDDEDADKYKFNVSKSTDGGTTWTVTNNSNPVAGPARLVGRYGDMDVVDADTVYVVYADSAQNLTVAKTTNGGTSWTITNNSNPVAGDARSPTLRNSIAAVNSTLVYVAYYASGNDLAIAKTANGGTSWNVTTVDSAGDVGDNPSIDVVDANTLYVSYYDNTNDDLKFAKTTNGGITWSVQTLDSAGSVGQYSSLDALDANTIYIAYYDGDNADLKVIRSVDAGQTWNIFPDGTTVDAEAGNIQVGPEPSIILASDRAAWISYNRFDPAGSAGEYLKVARLNLTRLRVTDANGRVTDNITVESNWTDTYASTTPGQTETRDYAVHAHFPYNITSAAQGAYGENASQAYAFDVDSQYYVDTHVQNTTTLSKDNLNDDNEQTSYAVGTDTVYVWVHARNVRSEEASGKSATTYVYASGGSRGGADATYTGTTGSDGWTAQLGSFAAVSPSGTWYFDSDVTGDNNTGTDAEAVTFTIGAFSVSGKVFHWANGTAVNSVTVTAVLIDAGVSIETKTDTTDTNGAFDVAFGTTPTADKEYTINITVAKGSLVSYLIQRVRA